MIEWLEHFFRDTRHASRSLWKNPGFAAAAILTLALGIGANTAIFSVLQGVLLAPLPYFQPDRLVILALYNRALKYPTYLSFPDFLDWQRDSHSLEQIAAFTPCGFDLTSPGTPEHVAGKQVSRNFFSTLGVSLALGRSFAPDEDHYGGPPAAIITDTLWRARFAGSPAVLGRPLTLNGIDYTIVGVLPPGFRLVAGFRFGDERADIFTPIGSADPLSRNDRTIHNILSVARLRPGITIAEARAQMSTVQEHIDALNPATESGQGISIEPLKRVLTGDVRGTLLLLLGAVAVVLLIACANVANLLLARSAGRAREFAVRAALGATRAQLLSQIIAETVLLSLAGGLLGLAVAKWGVSAVVAAAPETLPRAGNIGVNGPVLLFAFGLALAVGIIFGLLPIRPSLNIDTRGSTAAQGGAQRALVIVQIALALVLLAGAGLLLRTIRKLWDVNPGFDTEHVVTFRVGLASAAVETAAKTRAAYWQLVTSIRRIPGVQAADITALVPLGGWDNSGPFWVGPHRPAASMAQLPRALYFWTGPDYQSTMKIPLLRGRLLTPRDNTGSGRVVLIDSVLARSYFRGDPVGQNINIPHWGVARVVGVVGHVEHYGLAGSAPGSRKPQIYASFYELPDPWVPLFRPDIAIAARTFIPAATLVHAVHSTVTSDPVYDIHTMRELVSGAMSSQRLPMILLGAFAVLALALAWIGTYGVISCAVGRRVREVGIRMALGAVKGDVLRMVVWQGLRLALAGVVAGAAGALILGRTLPAFSRLLYGVRAADPLTLIAVSALLIIAALLACYIPARRAAKLDPVIALRHE